uniref:Tuftelin 1 n=1 Tax=Strigops habroptila TaxID=2489341 RepID=A0A672UML9_STRHB
MIEGVLKIVANESPAGTVHRQNSTPSTSTSEESVSRTRWLAHALLHAPLQNPPRCPEPALCMRLRAAGPAGRASLSICPLLMQVVLEEQNGSWLYPERLQADSWEQEEEDCSGEDVEKIRQTAKRLFTKLQEAEKRHQLERKAFERTVSQYQEEAEQTSSALRRAERSVVEKEVQVDELQRLLAGMEKEHRTLLLKMKEGEAELARLRSVEGDKLAQQDRSAQLEKEVAMLREKIHHLDDMLKSQQRKVRQMIEQLQNSKTVIQAKDAVIQELKERVAYLEAENLEMHDRIEHLIEKQVSRGGHSSRARSKSEYVSSKRLTGPKPLPLIRVVET